MKLDKDKKYRFAGDGYLWDDPYWGTEDGKWAWAEGTFQHFAHHGLVEEVREPLRGTGVVSFSIAGVPCNSWSEMFGSIEQCKGKSFRITAEEILEENPKE